MRVGRDLYKILLPKGCEMSLSQMVFYIITKRAKVSLIIYVRFLYI